MTQRRKAPIVFEKGTSLSGFMKISGFLDLTIHIFPYNWSWMAAGTCGLSGWFRSKFWVSRQTDLSCVRKIIFTAEFRSA